MYDGIVMTVFRYGKISASRIVSSVLGVLSVGGSDVVILVLQVLSSQCLQHGKSSAYGIIS